MTPYFSFVLTESPLYLVCHRTRTPTLGSDRTSSSLSYLSAPGIQVTWTSMPPCNVQIQLSKPGKRESVYKMPQPRLQNNFLSLSCPPRNRHGNAHVCKNNRGRAQSQKATNAFLPFWDRPIQFCRLGLLTAFWCSYISWPPPREGCKKFMENGALTAFWLKPGGGHSYERDVQVTRERSRGHSV